MGYEREKFGVERVSHLRDSLTITLAPLLTDWHEAWRKAVGSSDDLPTESEEPYKNLF